MTRWLRTAPLLAAALAAGCAGAPAPRERPSPAVAVAAGAGAPPATLEEAQRRMARRLEELARVRAGEPESLPEEADIRRRYEALLDRPGTPDERKPELLLRIAELAYREEESALRAAYDAGTEDRLPPGARYARSMAFYRRLVAQYPESSQALTAFYNLGYLYDEEGDSERSAEAYGEVLRLDPGTPYAGEIHMRLGEAAFDLGDVEGAIPHYRAVIDGGRPEYLDKALYKLGWCHYNREAYGEAVDAFSRVLARGAVQGMGSPEDLRAETLSVMARCFLEWGGVERLTAYLGDHPEGRPFGDRLYRYLGDLLGEASRYREAAGAYAAGIDAYPASAQNPEVERSILQALLTSGDAEAAAERRESWAERYGPGSPWDRAHGKGPLGPKRDSLVEEGLRLAAMYRHGRAQRGEGSLDRAIALYGRYLDRYGQTTEAGYELAYARAQALQEAGRLRPAADAYDRVARDPARGSHREEASYRRLEALGVLSARDPTLAEELVAAHEDYVTLNPASSLVPRVLFEEGELLFEAERFGPARQAFERVARAHPEDPLAPQALERIARCFFREESYPRVEEAGRMALAAGLDGAGAERVQRLVAFSIFKQAEGREATGDRAGANRDFLRLAAEFPAEEAAPIALYRAAENLQTLGREEEAARVFEQLAREHGESRYARRARVLSARIFASMGDWREAARNYEDLYRAILERAGKGEGAGAADALFEAARAWERAREPAVAARLYGELAAGFPADARLAEAHYRRGEALRVLGRPGEAAASYREAWASAAEGDAAAYRALAALALGKMALAAFREVVLEGDLEAALGRKEGHLAEAVKQFGRAASLPFAEPLTEALCRAGEAFEQMKEALLASERPPDLTPEEREEYDFLLEEKAFPLEEKAVGYYRQGIAAARKAGLHTPWVDAMYRRLEVLLPWAYQRPEEPALAWTLPRLPFGEGPEGRP